MSKSKDFDNTVLAMSEWLDERMDGYLILLTKNGANGMIMNGNDDNVVEALASGMEDHPELRDIVLRAISLAMESLELSDPNDFGDIDDFNMN